MNPPLIAHLEKHLGPIREGWTTRYDGAVMPFQIAAYAGASSYDGNAFSTIGLSEYPLVSRNSGKKIRCELLVVCRQVDASIPSALQELGTALISSDQALLRGDVVEFSDALVNDSPMRAWYASIPVYFSDSFESCKIKKNEEVVIIWLIPIMPDEASFVRKNGWMEFESKLQTVDPDLLDLGRSSAVGPE